MDDMHSMSTCGSDLFRYPVTQGGNTGTHNTSQIPEEEDQQ